MQYIHILMDGNCVHTGQRTGFSNDSRTRSNTKDYENLAMKYGKQSSEYPG